MGRQAAGHTRQRAAAGHRPAADPARVGGEGDRHAAAGLRAVADPASIDAQRFESDYRAARSVWSTDPARAGALLDDALRLWRGPAYGAFADGFAAAAAARLEELRVSALEDRAALFVRAGAATDARRVRQCASAPAVCR
jgi:Bacterial transcriptional activator domain